MNRPKNNNDGLKINSDAHVYKEMLVYKKIFCSNIEKVLFSMKKIVSKLGGDSYVSVSCYFWRSRVSHMFDKAPLSAVFY